MNVTEAHRLFIAQVDRAVTEWRHSQIEQTVVVHQPPDDGSRSEASRQGGRLPVRGVTSRRHVAANNNAPDRTAQSRENAEGSNPSASLQTGA